MKGEGMKLLNIMLIAVGTGVAISIGYFATITALLVKAFNEGNEEDVEEVRQVI
jgi:hypothetical protein